MTSGSFGQSPLLSNDVSLPIYKRTCEFHLRCRCRCWQLGGPTDDRCRIARLNCWGGEVQILCPKAGVVACKPTAENVMVSQRRQHSRSSALLGTYINQIIGKGLIGLALGDHHQGWDVRYHTPITSPHRSLLPFRQVT